MLEMGLRMLTLLRNLDCYCPKHIGKQDILICGDKLYKIQPEIPYSHTTLIEKIIDCDGMIAFPGFIDQHVHIIGGGGEGGFSSHVAEIDIDSILKAGVTTLVGLLGADSFTKSPEALYAKAKSLEAQGITTYLYSGCYAMPPATLTKNVISDLVLIDKVIGVGEIAISDHRSSHPSKEELLKMAADVHLGGLLGSKAGIVHLHLGDGKAGLSPLINLLKTADLPMDEFVPTHANRNAMLFKQAMAYCQSGGNMDLTSGEKAGISVPNAVYTLLVKRIDLSKVTVSSDANGSIPEGGASHIQTLYEDIVSCMLDKGINPEIVIRLVTENVAKVLKLYPKKGVLQEGSDADILITDKNYYVKKLICMGKIIAENK